MVKLTVILVRSGETDIEVRQKVNPDFDEGLDQAKVNDDLKIYIGNQVDDEAAYEDGRLLLSQRVDPALTTSAYEEAQDTLTHLLSALAADTEVHRKVAFFSGPNRACAATAMMMSCADVSHYENLTWRLTTLESASAPASLPIVVSNGLCNGDPQVVRMGGYKAAIEGGLFHCAAMPFNDGRSKCPLMKGKRQVGSANACIVASADTLFAKVVKCIKEKTHDHIDEWDEARDENGKRIHLVNYVQFLRLESEKDPWSITEMNPKVNIVVEFSEPKRYMLPPRKGFFDPKEQYTEWKEGPEPHIKDTIWLARQAGCDTVIMVISKACMEAILKECGESEKASPCSVATLTASIDDSASDGSSVKVKLHKSYSASKFIKKASKAIPKFGGPVDELLHPHEGNDPASALPVKWATFPQPEPEVIPADYPDLPPFKMSLEVPLPEVQKRKPVPAGQKKPKKSKPMLKPKAPPSPKKAPASPKKVPTSA